MEEKKRVYWIDTLKGIGILLVIAGHSIRGNDPILNCVYKLIYAVHMPLFFSVSGYLFLKGIERYQTLTISQFAVKKAQVYLKPFCVYSFLMYVVFFAASFVSAIRSSLESAGLRKYRITEYVFLMVCGENPYVFHLWYLWVLFLVTIVCFCVYKGAKKQGYAVCFAVAFILWCLRMLVIYHAYNAVMTFLRYMIFFVVGMKLYDREKFNKATYVAFSSVSFLYLIWHTLVKNTSFGALGNFGCSVLQLLSVILFIHNLSLLSKKLSDNKVLNYLGKNSMPIYLFHQPIFCAFVGIVCRKVLNVSAVTCFAVSIFTGLSASVLIIEISKRVDRMSKILNAWFGIRLA